MEMHKEDQKAGSIPWFILDATKEIQELQSEIANIAVQVLDDAGSIEVKRLWKE
jgi:hypothetical protein